MRCCPILVESSGDVSLSLGFAAKNLGVIGLKKQYFGTCGQKFGRTKAVQRRKSKLCDFRDFDVSISVEKSWVKGL